MSTLRPGFRLDDGFWQLCRRRVSLRRGPTRPRPRFALARLVLAFTGRLIRLAGADLVGVLRRFAALLFSHNRAPLDQHCASRDDCTTTSPDTWGQAGGDPAGAVNMDSNASRAREVERNISGVRFFIGLRRSCATRDW